MVLPSSRYFLPDLDSCRCFFVVVAGSIWLLIAVYDDRCFLSVLDASV